MIPLYVSERIRLKLRERHHVEVQEVEQCFLNHFGDYLRDEREDHATDPPTWWFISESNQNRKLKVVFIIRDVPKSSGTGVQKRIDLKTAYPPDATEVSIFERKTC